MEFIRQIVEANPYPMYIKDEKGKLVLANAAYAALHGLTAAALLQNGQPDFDYTFERDLAVLETGSETSFEEFYKLQDSGGTWFHTVKRAFKNFKGSRFLLSVSSDITEFKKSNLQSEESAKAKESFLLNASSEIRQSIQAIQDLARLMKKSLCAKDQEEYISSILSVTENLFLFPDLISNFAQIESGKADSATVTFDITILLKDLVKSLAVTAEGHDNLLKVIEPDEALPVLEGDPKLLSHLIRTLIAGFINHVRKGVITVAANASVKQKEIVTIDFCITVKGTDTSFDNFKHAMENLNQNQIYSETCTGLALCKSLVELQGGKFYIDTTSEQGNQLYFSLPFQPGKRTHETREKDAATVREKLKGLHILLAEDDQLNQLLTISHLQAWDIKVDIARDGEEALSKAKKIKYDLILMDIEMPNINGIEATSSIRNISNQNQVIPIIAFTANRFKYDFNKYMALGFTDCLLKPYHELKLYAVITKNTAQSILTQELVAPDFFKKEPALYDFSDLGSLADDPLFIRKMKQLFINTVPEQLKELTQAIQYNDWNTVALDAHRLKSTYGNINLKEAAEAMQEIETIARTKINIEKINDLMNIASDVTAKVVTIFSNELHP